jgi:hypothetical protein
LETARRALSLSARVHQRESRMREIRPSGSEGGVAYQRHPYLYPAQGSNRELDAPVRKCESLERLVAVLTGVC